MSLSRARLSLVAVAVTMLAVLVPMPGPASSSPTQTGIDPGAFVDAAYRDLLGRQAEPEGRSYWTGLLSQGESPRAVLAWIGDSPEHRRHMVTGAYDRYLRRQPDPGGLDFWADALGDVLTLTDLRTQLLSSTEYWLVMGGGTGQGLIQSLYQDVFGRQPDPGGLAYWTGLLDGGEDRVAVVTAIVLSAESIQQRDLSIIEAVPAGGAEVNEIGTVRVRVDTALVPSASVVRVSVDGRPLPGQVTSGGSPDLLVYQADRLPTWVPPDTPVPVIVTVLGFDGGTVARADYGFTLLVPREVVASFTTPLQPGQPRNNNIQRAAEYIDGDVIAVGASYSLNAGIGERTRARGFGPNGFIDEEGDVTSVVGGGVSQMATTFVNAAWFAGIRIDDFRQHTIYFERYPMCREGTLNWGSIDVVVVNDTPYPLTIDTSYTATSVTVALVGVPWAEVDSWIGEPFNTGGVGGPFSIRCGRTVTYPDGTTSEDTYFWRYNEGYPG